MSLWQNLTASERLAAVQTTAAGKNIEDRAVEKDWWVTAVLKALFDSSFTTKGILKNYDPGLRFCQIDGSLICVVSENVIYRSVDYPIVTYDKEGYFIWNGKRHWLLDCSYICVYCPVYHSPGMVHWYPYDPKIDSWSNELFKTDVIKVYMSIPNEEFLKKHNKTYFPSTREIWSIHQDGGQVYRNGEWVYREFSPVPIIVRNKIEEDEL